MCPIEKKSNEPENPERRKFLGKVIAFLGGVIAFTLGGGGAVYVLSPAWRGKKENWVALGPEADLPEGQPVKMDFTQRTMDGWLAEESRGSTWLLRRKGTLTAYNPHCTHMGCPYRWDATRQEFLCPCHGGVYDINGNVVSGPPPHALYQYPVRVDNGIISVLPEAHS